MVHVIAFAIDFQIQQTALTFRNPSEEVLFAIGAQ